MGRNVFIHVPPKPGGKLGLLDAASSIALFMAVGPPVLHRRAGRGRWCWRCRQAASLVGALLFALAAVDRARRRLPGDHADRARGRGSAGQRGKFWAAARARFGADAVEGPIAVLRIASVFFLVSVFWALFDQKASSWILQAETMDLHPVAASSCCRRRSSPPTRVLVMILIPYTQRLLYPTAERLGFPADAAAAHDRRAWCSDRWRPWSSR